MKLVVQVKLLPTPEQAAALEATLRRCNSAANWLSVQARNANCFSRGALQSRFYRDLKQRGLAAQAALHVLRKVADAYTAKNANLANGNLGKEGTPRHRAALAKAIDFRGHAAQPYDDRCLSWQHEARTVSIWTVSGRLRGIAFAGRAEQLEFVATRRQGESDLAYRDGCWYLNSVCEVPEPEVNPAPQGFLGVDLGIVNIAATSDGEILAGRRLNRYRRKRLRLRAKLQAKGTKAAKRLLKRQRRKEFRHARDVNHVISKRIVTVAERTGRGIGLERLKGIRDRVRLRRPQRATLHSWSFGQLGDFIVYKAKRAGVPVVFVDPRNTSRTCADCGYLDKRNRVSQAVFICRSCGVVAHADRNASRNIGARARMLWDSGAVSTVPASDSIRC